LLGLGPWQFEAACLALHALYLEKSYWRTQLSISFPRIRHSAGCFEPPFPVCDREMVQMILALRLFLPDAGLTLSTRETPAFRDGLIPICITSVSAGSKTEPGGYTKPGKAEEQFEVVDKRPPKEVARFIESRGLEPVFKDFDRAIFGDG
ncbi:2-iminoacetate synthase ThiH, partial [bacterium]